MNSYNFYIGKPSKELAKSNIQYYSQDHHKEVGKDSAHLRIENEPKVRHN